MRRGPKAKPIDVNKARRHLNAGLSMADAAKAQGVSVATLQRRLAALAQLPEVPDAAPANGSTSGSLRDKALAAIERALEGDDPRSIQAARAALDEHRREQQIDAYSDAQSRIMRAAVRLAAERLGYAIRAHVAAHDDHELGDAYKAAASLQAQPDDVDALQTLLLAPERAPILAAAGLADATP